MAKKKGLIKLLGAVTVGAGAALTQVPQGHATPRAPDLSALDRYEIGAYQSAIAAGSEAALQAFLREYPTSSLTPKVLENLLILVGNNPTANANRGDSGQDGIDSANPHRQSPSEANTNSNSRAFS